MARYLRWAPVAACLIAAAGPIFPDTGLTASCLLPRGGRFSHPVSPLSLRDFGPRLGRYLQLSGSLALYGLRGLGLEDPEGQPLGLPSPAVGPALSTLGTVGAFLLLPAGHLELRAGGGLFGCWIADPPLERGPVEAYLATATPAVEYEALTATLTRAPSGCWGGGAFVGGGLTWFIRGQLGLSVGAQYYFGGARLGLSGTYDAYDADTDTYSAALPLPVELTDARIDLDGLELLLGVRLRL